MSTFVSKHFLSMFPSSVWLMWGPRWNAEGDIYLKRLVHCCDDRWLTLIWTNLQGTWKKQKQKSDLAPISSFTLYSSILVSISHSTLRNNLLPRDDKWHLPSIHYQCHSYSFVQRHSTNLTIKAGNWVAQALCVAQRKGCKQWTKVTGFLHSNYHMNKYQHTALLWLDQIRSFPTVLLTHNPIVCLSLPSLVPRLSFVCVCVWDREHACVWRVCFVHYSWDTPFRAIGMTALLHLTAGELLREPGMGFVCSVLHFKDFRWFVTENYRKTKLYLKRNVTNVYRSCKSIMQEQVKYSIIIEKNYFMNSKVS